MEITTKQNLQMKNVLSLRGKFDQNLLMEKRKELDDVMKKLNVHPIHPAITTTFGVEQTPKGTVMDMEILVPVDSFEDARLQIQAHLPARKRSKSSPCRKYRLFGKQHQGTLQIPAG